MTSLAHKGSHDFAPIQQLLIGYEHLCICPFLCYTLECLNMA